jgi:exopolysaccharide biosynthesis protein
MFDVGYRPGRPQSLQQWLTEEDALAVVNGGFFTEGFEATGLTIADGQVYGSTYVGFGGMLSIAADGPQLRWLRQLPYNPAESLLAALQSFPILVKPGGQGGYSDDSVLRARRTVIGQDMSGRILLVVASSGALTLAEISRFLTDSDLDLAVALNLDGGASSGLLLKEPSEGIPAFTLLPTVITIRPKLAPD